MSRRTTVVKSVVAALMLFGLGGPAIGAEPTAHIDAVELTPGQAVVTLTTSDLPPTVSLQSADIRVTVDGDELPSRVTPQGRATTAAGASARQVMVLLDTSGSMSDRDITAARRAALDYARSLPPDVRVGLITFADRPRLAVRPTEDRAALAGALEGLKSGGNTALYDAVKLGVSTVEAREGSAERRLVVLSDGVDTSSTTSLAATTSLLRGKKVTADVVAFQYDEGDTSAVQQLAEARGGKILTADDAAQLSAAFTAIARRFTEHALLSVDIPEELAGKTAVMHVKVTSAAGVLSATREVTFPVAGAHPAATGTGFSWLPHLSWQLWLVAGLTFVTVLMSVLLIFWGGGRGQDTGKRVSEQIAQYGTQRNTAAPEQPREGSLTRTAVGWTEEMLRSRGWEEKLAEQLNLAGMTMRPAEWTVLRVCASVVLAGLLMLMGVNFFVAVVLGGLLGWVGTLLVVKIRISRRRAAFADQLPDVLQLVAGSLQSGFSLAQALGAVVREDTQPAAGEIGRALAETRIGVQLEDALDRVALRMASDDLKWIVMAIRIQRQVGGNLAEVLLTTVTTMRERAQTRRQVRALSAEGRLSAYVLIGLPFAMAAYFLLVRAEYMRPLYTTGYGILMLAGSAVLIVLGSFWMSKLVKVEV